MKRRPFDAVIFDQDGTLFQSDLDFRKIREELALKDAHDIIQALDARSEDERRQGYDILRDHEIQAAEKGNLYPGVEILMMHLKTSPLRSGLLTRNHAAATERVLNRFPCLQFDTVRTRDDVPVKPDPESVREICRSLGVSPRRTLMVGDFRHDLEVAVGSGATSALFVETELPVFAHQADFIIENILSVKELLRI